MTIRQANPKGSSTCPLNFFLANYSLRSVSYDSIVVIIEFYFKKALIIVYNKPGLLENEGFKNHHKVEKRQFSAIFGV